MICLMRLLWAVVFQRASTCQELWKAMSIALSASSLQMGGILLAPSRFWLILLLERVNSSSISGLWPDHQPDPGWDSWAGIQCNPGGGTGFWLWSLFFFWGSCLGCIWFDPSGCAWPAHCQGWQHLRGEYLHHICSLESWNLAWYVQFFWCYIKL